MPSTDAFDRHELILIDHAEKLRALEEADRQSAASIDKLEDDIVTLRQVMQDGFSAGLVRDTENSTILKRIEEQAFKSVPGNIANQISLHGLIWQIIGVVLLITVGLFGIYARIYH
jgi:hypothetical protein